MLNFQRVRQQLIKLSLITLSLSLTLIALPILKQSLAFQAQAAGLTPVITSVSPNSGSIYGGETVTIEGQDFNNFEWNQISAGSEHTCAIDELGKAYCWGKGINGELGNGGKTTKSSPIAINSTLSFTQITAGYAHTCAIDTTGQGWCWGSDGTGQLGNGVVGDVQLSPVMVDGNLSLTQISAGYEHTCAIDIDSKAWCWGSGRYGQLGNGASGGGTYAYSPVAVISSSSFSQIAVGSGAYTCALENITGKAWCWGSDASGQLGDGGTNTNQALPVAVSSGLFFSQISAGGDYNRGHTCALENITGKAWCWGYDGYGQLGDGGTNTNQALPVAVSSGLFFSQISAVFNHTCAIDMVGQSYCWGYDIYGQLGDGGTNTNQPSPVAVGSTLPFSQISAGLYHTCALDTTNKAYCWGHNYYGQLGNDGDYVAETTPAAVQIFEVNFGGNLARAFDVTPTSIQTIAPSRTAGPIDVWLVRIDGQTSAPVVNGFNYFNPPNPTISTIEVPSLGLTEGQTLKINGSDYFQKRFFSQVVASYYHSCGLDTNGKAYCWGYGGAAQLGNGAYDGFRPSPIVVNTSLSFSKITAGEEHTCAIDTTGNAWCWGYNSHGELGNGDIDGDYQPSPAPVDSDLKFSQISGGGQHTCAIDTTGKAWCWGDNDRGQLGNSDTSGDQKYSPFAISSSLEFSQISAGSDHACAIDITGKAWCWGYNRNGQIGNGDFVPNTHYIPIEVDSTLIFTQITAGYAHTCAIDTTSKAWCWGNNNGGALGNNDVTEDWFPSPEAVNSGLSFTQISAGYAHTCAIDTTNKAWCWGADSSGQIGDGGEIQYSDHQYSPVAINPSSSFTKITVSEDHTCAIDIIGNAWCWGDNSRGELGIGNNTSYSNPQQLAQFEPFLPQQLSATFNNGILATSYRMLSSGQIEAVIPTGVNYPIKFTVTNPTGQLATFIPAGNMEPVISEIGSPALDGPFNIKAAGYVLSLTIEGETYPVINNGDGTWSMPAGTIDPGLNPGVYDVIVNVENQDDERASETLVVDGLTILGNGTPTDPAGPIDPTTSPSSPGSPATGYGPKTITSSISGFLIPSLVITLLGAGMLILDKKFLSKSTK